jgi:ABC-type bacteriocin/lantibiotic exporter with double-glycine peptidase domain
MPQDSHLFTMTIRDNILLGNPSASTEQLAEAIRLADAQDFIQELEAGLDTLIGDNGYVKLSGGQAQRVALARALLKPGAVLMLDEFTSALDAHTEKRVLSNISKMPKRTIISISHKRLIKEYFDRIIRLNMQ